MIGWFSVKPIFLWVVLAVVALHSIQSFGAEDVYCWEDCIIGMRVVDVC